MTDRTIRAAADLDGLDFAKQGGMVPVIAQDASTGEVRMLGHANREALEKTLEAGHVHFWSRSRDELWMKGVTSGHVLGVVSLHADCDGDAVLARVRPAGPTCHTGERSCFGDGVAPPGSRAAGDVLGRLDATLAERALDRPADSYTTRLLDDPNLRLKKLGEETAELVAALATRDRERALEEAADLVYHTLVGLRAEGFGVPDLLAELDRRAG